MKTLIIYSSKYGCTEDCAKYLKSGLSGSITLTDINNPNHNAPDLESCDTVVLGSSIYIGKISKKIRKYCNVNMEVLRKKRVGIFLCCAFPEQAAEYITANFPPAILKSSIYTIGFGGEARISKMKFIDKSIMKAAIKSSHESLKISQENMDLFIKALNTH